MKKSLDLKPLEQALNGYLALDPESSTRLHGLQEKTVTIELLALQYSFQLRFHQGKIQLHPGKELPAEITIRGTPLNLFALVCSHNKQAHFLSEAVIIEGNAELGQEVIGLFEKLEIDWEEYLSRFIGDLPAHHIGRFTRHLISWGEQARESLLQNLNEYVHEEKPWFPPKEALQDFFREIDELRLDLDRLEARVKNLC